MKALLITPIVGLMILGFIPQLLTIAESSQEKAIVFADDMNAAIDCATRGVALEECSPNLMNHDFSPEMTETVELAEQIAKLASEQGSSVEVVSSGNRIIIQIE